MQVHEIFTKAEQKRAICVGMLTSDDLLCSYSCKDELYITMRLNYAYSYANEKCRCSTASAWNRAYDYIMNLPIDEMLKVGGIR